MEKLPNIVVVRHPRENIKKCSLRFLHNRENFTFLKATDKFSYDATDHILLEIDAPVISPVDLGKPILLLDSTWALLPKIRAKITGNYIPRSLPNSIKTAYPRQSKLFSDPNCGLATLEALYSALCLMGINDPSILDNYHFKDSFLKAFNPTIPTEGLCP